MFRSTMGGDSNLGTQEVIYADRNDRPLKDGGQHGAAHVERKASMRSLQQVAEADRGVGPRGSVEQIRWRILQGSSRSLERSG